MAPIPKVETVAAAIMTAKRWPNDPDCFLCEFNIFKIPRI